MPTDAEQIERQQTRAAFRAAIAVPDPHAAITHARTLLAASTKPADLAFCASGFEQIAESFVAKAGLKRVKTFIVRSVTVEPILPALVVESVFAGYVLKVEIGGFGSYVEELLQAESSLTRFQPDLVLVLLDLEEIAGRLPDLCADGQGRGVDGELDEAVLRMEQMLRGFRAHHAARMVVQGLVAPDRSSLGDVGDANLEHSLPNAVTRLNQRLARLSSTIPDCIFFDVDHAAARFGREQWRDTRLFLASRLAVSAGAFQAFARGLVRSFSPFFRPARKVLCTDLDNTLWGGVLGEEGPHGIQTGSAFPGNSFLGYQRYLKQLASRGILLAAVSKNNPTDVEEAFRLRAADLALTLDDFVARKIGWNEKAEALRELAAELSLGLDSFVFVDDNPVECEAIRQRLPEVAVIIAPVDEPWKLVDLLAAESFFDSAMVTDDDVNRAREYKAQAERSALAGSTANRDEFLASLDIMCTFVDAREAPLSRSAQLLAKTNQFNLTTRRHSAAELEAFAARAGAQAVAVRVRDRFGDAGVVGLVLARMEGDACVIDSLLLSCRVIGRGIETALLALIARRAAEMGARTLIGEFIETKKNAPCANFYPDHGFLRDGSRAAAQNGSIFYKFDLSEAQVASPTWLTLEGNEAHDLTSTCVTP